MTIAEELTTISLTTLIEYHKAGFKLVPLTRDSKTPNIQRLLTSNEEKRSREESSDGLVHPVNYISNHPGFWDESRIEKEQWRFNNVATTFGKTHLTDEHGVSLYLNALDIDSKQVFDCLAIIQVDGRDRYFIDEMCKTTSVTQTRKRWGRHIYWLSHKQHRPVRTRDCKVGCEFEIKTDNSTGLSTLPPSTHRDDSNFHYQAIGLEVISIQDDLYDGLLEVLTTCIREERFHDEQNTHDRYTGSSSNKNNFNKALLTDTEIEDIVAALMTSYHKNSRHNIVYGLSGYLCKCNIALESARKVIDTLCHTTGDEESKTRMDILNFTYNKAQGGGQVAGYLYLKEVLIQINGEDNANAILKTISQILRHHNRFFGQLEDTIAQELSEHIYEVICYTPLTFIISHSEKKQILHGRVAELAESKVQYIHYNNVIINAMPAKITRYENPSDIEIKYEVEFETPTGQSLRVQPSNLDEILGCLRVNGLVYKVRAAEEALPAILHAYYREGRITIRREIETPGFYLIDNKIEPYKVDHKQPMNEEIKKCADLLLSLQPRYKRKEIFTTFLLWGIMAPFSYILKQLDGEQWMPWLFPYGWTNTGKTTNGRIVLAIWRKHKDRTKHDIGFSSTDNVARLGRAISYNTYPVLINEVQLSDDRQKQLVETLKHAVQSQTARTRLRSRSVPEHISALSPCILTSNDPPPQDTAFRRRIIPIYYSKEDAPSQDEREQFNSLLRTGFDTLGILGDFVADYALENQEILVNNKSDWIGIAKHILIEFFKAAGKEVPDWIDYFIQETQVQDMALEQEQIVRGFFIKAINEAFGRNYRALTPKEDIDEVINENTIQKRLDFCCEKELIPFLRKKDGCVLIFHDIMHELKNHRINSVIHLTQLATMFQSEVKPVKLNGTAHRLISIPSNKFLEFISPAISL